MEKIPWVRPQTETGLARYWSKGHLSWYHSEANGRKRWIREADLRRDKGARPQAKGG